MDDAIEIKGLVKRYGPLMAVDGIDLTIRRGEIFALLGPNGAGKTTTIEILEGFLRADSGTVRVLGHDPAKGEVALRQRIGIVPQESVADPHLTVREMVQMAHGTYPDPRPVDELITLVGLAAKANVRTGKLSGGQRRRLDVALALVGNPDLLFLDEPTTGFDPDARRQAWALIRTLNEAGLTVILTTHYMDEAQNLANRIAVIVSGRIISEGTPAALRRAVAKDATIRFSLNGDSATLPSSISGFVTTHHDNAYTLVVPNERVIRVANELTGWSVANGMEIADLEIIRPSLEDIYLSLIKSAEAEGSPS
ncbi:ABC transporter ATP-binding protein [Parvularcula sp. LCG005]|uniref:ABC transporter ATP-binding protein n=1 Tax=Parvularcula sp. LCG005 TaxID=3078805 RepID=UPI00294260E3|nr:ABC transporter ATP-binding protein [Parvularcula sp. LCG005]WOI52264.1 ABC transporter ATP-binding protein [Parvularcula sp. LCG005]